MRSLREELRSKKVFLLEIRQEQLLRTAIKDHFKPEDVVVVLFHDSGSRYVKCLMTGCANVVFLKKLKKQKM
jgi:hypothetical protein